MCVAFNSQRGLGLFSLEEASGGVNADFTAETASLAAEGVPAGEAAIGVLAAALTGGEEGVVPIALLLGAFEAEDVVIKTLPIYM